MTRPKAASAAAILLLGLALPARGEVTRYVRYRTSAGVSYGVLEGETVKELAGDLFSEPQLTGETLELAEVELLAPVQPAKVIGVGLNYRSHLADREPAREPGLFFKSPTSIVGPGRAIVLPEGASSVHYEAEMVLVIGKQAKDVPAATAQDYIFGVTAGNDVSARSWQAADLQWFRAKGSDTFGPIGPVVVTGLDPSDLLLRGKLDGEVVQEQRTSDLLFGPAQVVSYISRYVTLEPGDVIFTGTPGRTRALESGDVFEVELEGVGVLRNPVVGPQER